MLQFVGLALVGKIIIFLLQKFPKHTLPIFREGRLLDELFACDLCLGVWIYFGLAFLFDVDGGILYVPVLSEFIIGMVTSFIVHIFSIGWNSKFQTLVIE